MTVTNFHHLSLLAQTLVHDYALDPSLEETSSSENREWQISLSQALRACRPYPQPSRNSSSSSSAKPDEPQSVLVDTAAAKQSFLRGWHNKNFFLPTDVFLTTFVRPQCYRLFPQQLKRQTEWLIPEGQRFNDAILNLQKDFHKLYKDRALPFAWVLADLCTLGECVPSFRGSTNIKKVAKVVQELYEMNVILRKKNEETPCGENADHLAILNTKWQAAIQKQLMQKYLRNCYGIKYYIQIAQQFLRNANYLLKFTHTELPESFDYIPNSDCAAFINRWFKVFKNQRRTESTLRPEYVNDFKRTYFKHSNPKIVELAKICLKNFERDQLDKKSSPYFTKLCSCNSGFNELCSMENILADLYFDDFRSLHAEVGLFLIDVFVSANEGQGILEDEKLQKLQEVVEKAVAALPSLELIYSLWFRHYEAMHEQLDRSKISYSMDAFLNLSEFCNDIQFKKNLAVEDVDITDIIGENNASSAAALSSSSVAKPSNKQSQSSSSSSASSSATTAMPFKQTPHSPLRAPLLSSVAPLPFAFTDFEAVMKAKDIRPGLKKIKYDDRVKKRFQDLQNSGRSWLATQRDDRDLFVHTFPLALDRYVGTVFSKEDVWQNPKGHQDLQYKLPIEIIEKEVATSYVLRYTMGKDERWYHRDMTLQEGWSWEDVDFPQLDRKPLLANAKKFPVVISPRETFEPGTESLLLTFPDCQIRLYRVR